MQTWYSLKVSGFHSKFDKNCEAKIVFADIPSENGTYDAYLRVRWKGRVTNFKTTFVAIDHFPPVLADVPIEDTSDPAKQTIRLSIPENYAFLTLVTCANSYKVAVDRYGPAAAHELFNAVHDWGFLEGVRYNPRWYQGEQHGDIDLGRLADEVFYDEDVTLATNAAGDIFDDFLFSSQVKAEQLIEDLDNIPVGNEDGEQHRDATAFELWCEKTIRFLLLGGFDPVVPHPNGQTFNRRDLVAINLDMTVFGRRIRSDYQVRHLVFEVKNKYDLQKPDVVQTTNYLEDLYGRLGFIIYRSDALALDSNGAYRFRAILRGHEKSIIELTTGMLRAILRELSIRQGPLFDTRLCLLLNDYEHIHCNEPQPVKPGPIG